MSKWIMCLCVAVATSVAGIAGGQMTRPGGRDLQQVRLRLQIQPTPKLDFSSLRASIQAELQRQWDVQPSVQFGLANREGDGLLDISFNVPSDIPKEAIKKLSDQIVREVEKQMGQLQAAYMKERDELVARIKTLDASILDLQEKLRKTDMRVDFPAVAINEVRLKLNQERQSLAIELAGMDARREALRRTIAEQSKVVAGQVQEDPIANELQTVVKVRTQQLEDIKIQYEAGRAHAIELSAATVAVAEAKAKLLERQELVKTRAGGEMLAAWNRELLNLSIDKAEKAAKADYIDRKLEALQARLDIEARQMQRATLERELAQVQNKLSEAEKVKPTVTVLSGY